MLFTDFNVGNGPAEDVEAEHDLEFQFALFQDDQSDLDFSEQINDNSKFDLLIICTLCFKLSCK